MVKGDIVTDLCKFTDYDPHSVVDKKAAANGGTWVYFDTRQ